jgi:Mce-associated membrane protein
MPDEITGNSVRTEAAGRVEPAAVPNGEAESIESAAAVGEAGSIESPAAVGEAGSIESPAAVDEAGSIESPAPVDAVVAEEVAEVEVLAGGAAAVTGSEAEVAGAVEETAPAGVFEERAPAGVFEEIGPAGVFEERAPAGVFEEIGPAGVFEERGPAAVFGATGPRDASVEEAGGLVDAGSPGSPGFEGPSTRVHPAGTQADHKANGSGTLADATATGATTLSEGKAKGGDGPPTEGKAKGSGKAERTADGSGPKADSKTKGSKSPKKPKKKSPKAKSQEDEHEDEAVYSVTTPPVAAESEESAPANAGKAAAGVQARLRRIFVDSFVAVVLGVVAIGLAVALALTMLHLSDNNSLDSARTSALATARTYSVELAGYNYLHLDQDFAVVLSHSTPSFQHSFSQSSDALKSTLVKYHASAQATVVAAGLVSASTSRAVALVFLDQTVTNSTQSRPTTDRSQVEITLVRSGGRWLIDQVTLL